MTKGYWKSVKELKQPNALQYYCRLYVYYCLIADITSTVNFLSYFCSIYVLNLTEDTQSSWSYIKSGLMHHKCMLPLIFKLLDKIATLLFFYHNLALHAFFPNLVPFPPFLYQLSIRPKISRCLVVFWNSYEQNCNFLVFLSAKYLPVQYDHVP